MFILMQFKQSMLYDIDPSLENMSEEGQKKWNDVSGRVMYAGMLITNQLEGALNMIIEATYPG